MPILTLGRSGKDSGLSASRFALARRLEPLWVPWRTCACGKAQPTGPATWLWLTKVMNNSEQRRTG